MQKSTEIKQGGDIKMRPEKAAFIMISLGLALGGPAFLSITHASTKLCAGSNCMLFDDGSSEVKRYNSHNGSSSGGSGSISYGGYKSIEEMCYWRLVNHKPCTEWEKKGYASEEGYEFFEKGKVPAAWGNLFPNIAT